MALYNQHLLRAVCSSSGVNEVIAVPRHIAYGLEAVPANLTFHSWAAGTKVQYMRAVLAVAGRVRSASLVICGHLNLLPFAQMLAVRFGCPVLPVCYGAEAYTPTAHRTSNYLCRRLDAFIAIRKRTAELLKEWANIPDARFYYLPNCVDVNRYGVAPPRVDLVARYGLKDKTVIATVGRVDSSEKNKGFDEVIETLPLLLNEVPNIAYLVLGDGDDRERLENKARALGVGDRVVFAGYVRDEEKADHLRLADVVAMPGSDPVYFDRYPFRFAFLEPLACGVPVVGSMFDCQSEREDPVAQRLVIQVDPDNRADIKRGILEALRKTERVIDPYITSLFTFEAFEKNAHDILEDVLGRNRQVNAA
jgi:glycosyltransferase involved in cell wall biosynthesis